MSAILSIFAGVLSTLVILMLYARLRRAELAAGVALDVAEIALDHDEMALGLCAGERLLDDDEAQEEREWIAERRKNLARVRALLGMQPARLADKAEVSS